MSQSEEWAVILCPLYPKHPHFIYAPGIDGHWNHVSQGSWLLRNFIGCAYQMAVAVSAIR